MRALTFQGIKDVACTEAPDPTLEQPTDAIVRVELSAICGSDLHVYRGAEAGLDPGTVLGHEFAGEVLEVGSAVEGIAPGDRVVAPFSTSCGACPACERGLSSRCEVGQLFGWVEGGQGLHGGQAELVRVPLAGTSLVKVKDGRDPAALFAGDVMSTGMYLAALGGVGPGDRVAVIGCGPVGLM
ncbi:MAG: alcohol dehydrogenase catalytic domain-containing protein, partial [Planctomycetota bacterium]|nr:alcohol dehydrogenase catalytic domain-containing protein [Planctomycetota bacterium]